MNKEDEKLIAEYMCWQEDEPLIWHCPELNKIINFDLNDAGLCVKEMQKCEDWIEFYEFTIDKHSEDWLEWAEFTAWFYNEDNFFESTTKWLKEKKNG